MKSRIIQQFLGKQKNLNTSFLQNFQLNPMAATSADLVGKIIKIGGHE